MVIIYISESSTWLNLFFQKRQENDVCWLETLLVLRQLSIPFFASFNSLTLLTTLQITL
jgi:hypothetical protein